MYIFHVFIFSFHSVLKSFVIYFNVIYVFTFILLFILRVICFRMSLHFVDFIQIFFLSYHYNFSLFLVTFLLENHAIQWPFNLLVSFCFFYPLFKHLLFMILKNFFTFCLLFSFIKLPFIFKLVIYMITIFVISLFLF
jgi:hypothetical protein